MRNKKVKKQPDLSYSLFQLSYFLFHISLGWMINLYGLTLHLNTIQNFIIITK